MHEEAARTTEVAVLGTGVMGAPMARRLAQHGFGVRVWNRTPSKTDALAAHGVTVCSAAAEAVAGADLVLTMLKDADTVETVMELAAAGLTPGTVWVQCSTVGTGIDRLAAWAADHQLDLVDAPVQGTKQPAEQGTLVVMASAPTALRPRVDGVFGAIGSRTVWVSERPGDASRLKLALNVWVAALTHGVAETMQVAERLGIDPTLVSDVVTGGPMDSGFFQGKSNAIARQDFSASFTVDNAVKDAALVLEAVGSDRVSVDLTAAAHARWRRAAAQGHGEADMIASYLAGPTERA